MIRNPNALCAQIAEAARASDFGTACHFMLDLADFLGPGGELPAGDKLADALSVFANHALPILCPPVKP